MKELKISIPAFKEGDFIPLEHSPRGKNISPEIIIENINKDAVTMAITMDDASHPIFPNFNHWVIWNLPIMNTIPAAIKKGKIVEDLSGAMQGAAYGRQCYKGPKPPFKSIHEYVFTVYILDSKLELSWKSNRDKLIEAMEGHVLQKASYSGKFQSRRKTP